MNFDILGLIVEYLNKTDFNNLTKGLGLKIEEIMKLDYQRLKVMESRFSPFSENFLNKIDYIDKMIQSAKQVGRSCLSYDEKVELKKVDIIVTEKVKILLHENLIFHSEDYIYRLLEKIFSYDLDINRVGDSFIAVIDENKVKIILSRNPT